MSLFQCENCGCCENTALTSMLTKFRPNVFDWHGIEERKGMKLCSACSPAKYDDGTKTKYGKWHGRFNRDYLPKGMFITNSVGNLVHKETEEDYSKYILEMNK